MSKIVVGVDGSEASKDALRWAVEEARLRKVPVDAVHAWQVPIFQPDIGATLAPGSTALEVTAMLPQVAEAARLLVEQVVQEVVGDGAGVEVQPVTVEGPPASSLIAAARDADLVVVGSRGHGGFTGLVLGSVSLQIVQHASCPAVVVRPRDDEG